MPKVSFLELAKLSAEASTGEIITRGEFLEELVPPPPDLCEICASNSLLKAGGFQLLVGNENRTLRLCRAIYLMKRDARTEISSDL